MFLDKKNLAKINFRYLPEYSFYFFIFLLPWQTRWIIRDYQWNGGVFEYGRVSLYAFEIALFLFLFFCFFFQRPRIISGDRASLFFLLFVFYCFLSIIWSADQWVAFSFGARALAGWLLFVFLANSGWKTERMALVAVLAGALEGFLAISQFFSQEVRANTWLGMAAQQAQTSGAAVIEYSVERWLRAYGSLPHPNILGGLGVMAWLALIYLFFRLESLCSGKGNNYIKRTQLLFLILGSLVVCAVFFSFSRAAWVVFLFLGAVGLWRIRWTSGENWSVRYTRTGLSFFLFLFIFFSLVCRPLVTTRLGLTETANRLELMSINERKEGIGQSLAVIKDNFWLGTGVGNYVFAIKERRNDAHPWQIQPTHNVYLLSAAETGIVVFLLLALGVWLAIGRLKGKNIFFWLTAGAIFFLFLFDHWWWTLPSGFYSLWMLVALAHRSEINP